MSHGYPYRVTVWRRALQARPRLVKGITLVVPGVVGAVLLLISIPAIGRALSSEERLTEGRRNDLIVRTDCDRLTVWVEVDPDVDTDLSRPEVEYGVRTAVDVIFKEAPSFTGETTPGDSLPPDPRQPTNPTLPPDPRDPLCDVAEIAFGVLSLDEVLEPWVTEVDGGKAEKIGDRRYRIHVDLDHETRVRITWPHLVRYSHLEGDWEDRLVGARSAAMSLAVRVIGLLAGETPWSSVETDVSVFAPFNFEVSKASKVWQYGRAEGFVGWRKVSDHAPLSVSARFRTESHEAKTNFITLAAGAVVGLGITLIIETLIALLYQLQRWVLAEGPPEAAGVKRSTPGNSTAPAAPAVGESSDSGAEAEPVSHPPEEPSNQG